MIALYKKEISVFFSTFIGPLIIGLFLLVNGLFLWSDISKFNILENAYASMDAFFTISPILKSGYSETIYETLESTSYSM